MAPEHPHRLQDRLPHHRLTETLHQTREAGADLAVGGQVNPDETPGEHQTPG